MKPLTCALLSSAGVSFFAEALLKEPAGVRGALLIGVASVLTPELMRRFSSSVLFSPDVTITADPLDPDAKMIAGGIRSAMRMCESEGRAVKVLVSRVPGHVVVVELNAVRRRCTVKILSGPEAVEQATSQSALPPFTTGAAPACLRVCGDGDNLRLVLRPPGGRGARITCGPQSVGFAPAIAAELLMFAAALGLAGPATAFAGVLLPAIVAGIMMRRMHRLGLVCDLPSSAGKTILVQVACGVVVLFNLFRFAVL